MYLSSLQVGLQSAHCLGEMFLKYPQQSGNRADMLYDWAHNHKTMILLNGGYSSDLQALDTLFHHGDNIYPHSSFCESGEALSGALTCVGVILPEKIYTRTEWAMELTRPVPDHAIVQALEIELSPFEIQICQALSNHGLAR